MKVLQSNIQDNNNIGDHIWDLAAKITSVHQSPHSPQKRPVMKDLVKDQAPTRSLAIDRLQCKLRDLEARLIEPWLAI